jgi:hypothetical protein
MYLYVICIYRCIYHKDMGKTYMHLYVYIYVCVCVYVWLVPGIEPRPSDMLSTPHL